MKNKSSTETALVRTDCADVSDTRGWAIFCRSKDMASVYQDNKSAMLLEQNGPAACSKRTQRINILRYFFVADRVAKIVELLIKY